MTFVSYAQNYEDLVLWRALGDVEDGFYIDIGASDPKLHSVTLAFYERGWHGVNVEPIQRQHAMLMEQRTRDISINALVGDIPGIALFYEFPSLGLSTMNEAVARRHIESGLTCRTLSLPIVTLASICATRAGQPVHFLKIDVEGAEREVLLGMDFKACRPWIIVVEATEPMSRVVNKAHWEDLLTSQDYIFAYFDGLNAYYVAAERTELIEKLAVPPNVFDEFVTADQVALQAQAEEWRQELIALRAQAEAWRLDLLESVAVSQRAHERMQQLEDALGNLEQQLAQERKVSGELELERQQLAASKFEDAVSGLEGQLARERQANAELEVQRQQLEASLTEAQMALARSQDEVQMLRPLAQEVATLRNLPAQVQELERKLHALAISFSWRVTGPLRLLSRKVPFVAQALRQFFARHPRLKRLVVSLARRLLRRGSPPVIAAQVAQVELQQNPPRAMAPKNLAALQRPDPVNWFFLGDTIEWLEARPRLSGVGKVTTELFCAAHESHASPRLRACAGAPNEVGLAGLDDQEVLAYLAQRGGAEHKLAVAKAGAPRGAPKTTHEMPMPGDHILFTGVIWTDHYTSMFHSLANDSIRFSVFVYDIIPILNPEYVDAANVPAFQRWLRAVLVYADCVFVSSETIKDQLLRWATLSNVYVNAKIFSVGFGSSAFAQVKGLQRSPALARVRMENFVLCVGTIDQRKNQALLCHLWPRLIAELGREQTPQLVLVGHDHIGLGRDPSTQAALQAGDILVLEGLCDGDVASLYESCQFTAFPSLNEGYGLPVSESLAFNKVCVASDLPVIRDHADELPWYFPVGDEAAAYVQLCRAITDLPARQATEALIAATYRHHRWMDTYVAMATHIAALRLAPVVEPLAQPAAPVIPGFSPPPLRETIAAAQLWCTHDNPDVSFLIINWRAAELTRACVQHIWASTSDVTYEIIIVDNGSPETDLQALADLGSGVRLVPLGVNRFFGEACNIAAEHARGRHLCLLNNDCFGEPGWLPRLVRILDTEPTVGAAGPLFLFPDLTVQEAGGLINDDGIPIRFGRGDQLVAGETPDYLVERSVDYISAAALVLSREVYFRAGGFDLGFEPAYYEDADLCLKLRTLGLSVRFCPEARAVHIEGAAANHDPVAEARRRAMGDLNRAKFLNRWGRFLQERSDASLEKIASEIFCDVPMPVVARGKPEAAIYTPYALTPGGGERFLLTIASILAQAYDVSIVTPNPYSRLRLLNIGFEFGLDLSACRLQTEDAFLAAPAPALMITVGNHVVPPIVPRTDNSFFICQFPFPMGNAAVPDVSTWPHAYRRVIAYSDYAKAHILAAQNTQRMPNWPVEVVYPAVPQHPGQAAEKKPYVLTVGRFFAGGHNKRHDLMIAAFRTLREGFTGELEMHIVGSSMPDPVHMQYLEDLFAMASDLPVTFHVNASPETLTNLYRDAAIYWHATGLGADLEGDPSMAEHFGISLAEAMTAECVPMAFNAGGPREIVSNGESGYLYRTTDELVQLTRHILEPGNDAARRAMGQAAGRRAREFAPEVFRQRIWDVLQED